MLLIDASRSLSALTALNLSTSSMVFLGSIFNDLDTSIAVSNGFLLLENKLKLTPLSMMAPWNSPSSILQKKFLLLKTIHSPSAFLDWTSRETEADPALSPNMVTLSGFPPNAAIFTLTHSNASIWSFSPLFPDTSSSWVLRKPEKYCLVNIERLQL